MTETSTTPESSTPVVLEYQLTEADVHHYCIRGRPRACWLTCRDRKTAMLVLAALGLFLIGMCYHSYGFRSGTLALVTTLGVLTALAWSHRAPADRRICRLAHEMGLPCDVRLVVSPEGIVKSPGASPDDPGRTFTWSDVVGFDRLDDLTIVRLRPARSLLIVPDRAFPDAEARAKVAEKVRRWRGAAVG
jgi:hypothetical protein